MELHIDIDQLYREIVQALHAAEIRVAELRGQKELIERMVQPTVTQGQAEDTQP